MKLTAKLKKAISTHAKNEYPRECCGVVVGGKYIACMNISENNDQFEIDPKDLAKAEDSGEIQAYVHSHPDASGRASDLDMHQIEFHAKPWIICAYPDIEFEVYEPCGYKSPLVGRNFHHGWQDCYSLVRDFYSRELGTELANFERKDKWWEDPDHKSLYIENFADIGFYEVAEPQYGDMIVCKVGRTAHPNHAVIWLGSNSQLQSEQSEACVGSTLILHHLYNRKSIREIYTNEWRERTVKILRHRDVKND